MHWPILNKIEMSELLWETVEGGENFSEKWICYNGTTTEDWQTYQLTIYLTKAQRALFIR